MSDDAKIGAVVLIIVLGFSAFVGYGHTGGIPKEAHAVDMEVLSVNERAVGSAGWTFLGGDATLDTKTKVGVRFTIGKYEFFRDYELLDAIVAYHEGEATIPATVTWKSAGRNHPVDITMWCHGHRIDSWSQRHEDFGGYTQ